MWKGYRLFYSGCSVQLQQHNVNKLLKRQRMDYIPENHSHVTICLNLLIEAGADVNVKTKKAM